MTSGDTQTMAKRKKVPPRQIELEEGYYLTNFQKLLSFVKEVYGDLLQKEEKAFLKSFAGLDRNAQLLYVRLILRSKTFFREGKLNYPEIQIQDAVRTLQKAKLLEVNPEIEFPDIAEPFTVSELKEFFKEVLDQRAPTGSRAKLLSEIEPYEEDFSHWVLEKDRLLWPLYGESVEKFQLLFFGSLGGPGAQGDMAQFILEDLGVMKFEKIVIDKKTRYFESRAHLDGHYQWVYWHAYLWEACAEKDLRAAKSIMAEIEKIKMPTSPLQRRLSRSRNMMAKLYEGAGDLKKALKLYEKSSLEPARERLARLYDKLDQPKKALELCQRICEAPSSESERYFGEFFCEKMKRKLGHDFVKRKKLPTPEEVILTVTWNKEGRVEKQVLDYLKENSGLKGFYSENDYWNTLAALLFWNEFWASGPGVFYHPFEQVPRDFYGGGFYQRQKRAIKEKINYWQNHISWEEEVCRLYEEKMLTACRLTNWKKTDIKNLKKLLKNIPKDHILKITEQILKDPRQYRSGLPDLILYKKKADYILGEVKSPNDAIQTSQKRWIDKFSEWGFPFVIYRVPS
jgi:hypothetical protein